MLIFTVLLFIYIMLLLFAMDLPVMVGMFRMVLQGEAFLSYCACFSTAFIKTFNIAEGFGTVTYFRTCALVKLGHFPVKFFTQRNSRLYKKIVVCMGLPQV